MSGGRPRICLLLESFHPVVGGMELQGRALAEGLAARGLPVLVVTRRPSPDLARLERLGDVEVHRVGAGAGRWRALPAVLRRLRALRERYDLIHVSGLRTFGLAAVAAAAALPPRFPVVLKADNAGELSGEFFDPGLARYGVSHRSPALAPLNRTRHRVLRRADHFIAISGAIRDEFLAQGVAFERVSLIPNGVDLTRFRPAQAEGKARLRERLGLPERARIVVFAGRLVSWKGPLILLEAWRRL
ncbi:MAG: glycosyltransferase family 4 protein, partial [Gemmatimonadota bacterium]